MIAVALWLPARPALATCHTAFFDPTAYQVTESAGSVVVTVENPGSLPQQRTVDFATADGTAKAGIDFEAASGTLSFGPGNTSRTITIPIRNDSAHEGTESFTVVLSTRSGSCISDLSNGQTATVTISDDDAAKKTATSPDPGRTPRTSATPKKAAASRSPSVAPKAIAPKPTSFDTYVAVAEAYDAFGYEDLYERRAPAWAFVGIVVGSVALTGVAVLWVRGS